MQVITQHYWFIHNLKAEIQLSTQVNILVVEIQYKW